MKAIYDLLFDKPGQVSWDDLRPALVAQLAEMQQFARDLSLLAGSPSVNEVDAEWTTPVWTSFYDELKARLRRRIWWSDIVNVYELWAELKLMVPRAIGGFGGPDVAARELAQIAAGGRGCEAPLRRDRSSGPEGRIRDGSTPRTPQPHHHRLGHDGSDHDPGRPSDHVGTRLPSTVDAPPGTNDFA